MNKLMRSLEKRLMLDASIAAIGGNVLWLDGADQATILDAEGDDASSGGVFSGAVATWQDKSGNNNHLSHTTVSRQPGYNAGALNGNGTITFDGNDALYAVDAAVPTLDLSTNGFTLFTVLDPATLGGSRIIINKESSYEVGINSGRVQAAVATTDPGGWAWGGTANNALTTNWHIVGFEHANTTWRFHENGVLNEEITPAGNETGNIVPSSRVFSLGGRGSSQPTGSFFSGDMAEVILFNRELTADEYHDVENYLADKWGLSITNATPTEATNVEAFYSNTGTVTLDASVLSFSDADNTDSLLSYTVTSLASQGTLKLSGVDLNINDTFTQQDIINGNVTYDHLTSVTGTDSFQFTVNDRLATTAVQTFNFNIAADEVANNTVILDEGDNIDITNADLAYTDNATLGFREQLTIDSSLTNSDLTDFTMLLDETNMSANFWASVKADGSDIYITASDGVTKLSRELVSFDKFGQTMELHVKVPLISSTVDTDLFLYYGNSAGGEVNSTSTWDANTQMVQHFEETTGTATDSTANGYDGSVTSGSYGAGGVIGDGVSFQSGRNITVSQALDTSGNFTIDFWANYSTTGTWQTTFFQNNGTPWQELLTVNAGNNQFYIWTRTGGYGVPLGMTVDYGSWHKYTFAYDGTNLDMYKDGALENSVVYNWSSNPVNFMAGRRTDTTQYLNASMDEYTFDTTERSADWIAAEYAMQNNPAAFYATGTAEALQTTLTYTLTDMPDNGTLTLNGALLNLSDTFTQDDIDNNRVNYEHDDSDTTLDSFDFMLSSSLGNSLPSDRTFTFDVTAINDAPVVIPPDSSDGSGSSSNSNTNNANNGDNNSGSASNNGFGFERGSVATGELIRSILNDTQQSAFYGNNLQEIVRENNTFEVSRVLGAIDRVHKDGSDAVKNVIERGLDKPDEGEAAWLKALNDLEGEEAEIQDTEETMAEDLDDLMLQNLGIFDQNVQELIEAL